MTSQTNEYLKTSSDGRVEHPWDVRCTQNKYTVIVVADTLHLHKKLGLDTPSRLRFVVGT
jgi:hypothetical protein